VTQTKHVSDDTAHVIDQEIREVIERNYATAKKILTDNLDKLHAMAEALIKYETIDSDQLLRIMQGQDPGIPSSWVDNGGKPPAAPPGSKSANAGGSIQPVTPKPASSS
jgi:cell division protease FtsH